MREGETLPIDREVIKLTGKARPKALFIPTASYDSVEYWEGFQRVYGGELGCETAVLYLLNLAPSRAELEESILSSDLIYVGGGNTLKMMRRWRKLGVDRLLEQAYNRGTVAAGGSAAPTRRDLTAVAMARFTGMTGDSINPDEVVIVGDTPHDVDCARAHGCRALAVATGSFSRDDLQACQPDLLVDDLSRTAAIMSWMLESKT